MCVCVCARARARACLNYAREGRVWLGFTFSLPSQPHACKPVLVSSVLQDATHASAHARECFALFKYTSKEWHLIVTALPDTADGPEPCRTSQVTTKCANQRIRKQDAKERLAVVTYTHVMKNIDTRQGEEITSSRSVIVTVSSAGGK